MPDRMSEDMPEDMPGRMPELMPDRMPDRMPEDMSDRMPEDSPVTKRINVMVGMTRSKVIFVKIDIIGKGRIERETKVFYDEISGGILTEHGV
jgi:hypothetical protein